jgi:hypothetical protein
MQLNSGGHIRPCFCSWALTAAAIANLSLWMDSSRCATIKSPAMVTSSDPIAFAFVFAFAYTKLSTLTLITPLLFPFPFPFPFPYAFAFTPLLVLLLLWKSHIHTSSHPSMQKSVVGTSLRNGICMCMLVTIDSTIECWIADSVSVCAIDENGSPRLKEFPVESSPM